MHAVSRADAGAARRGAADSMVSTSSPPRGPTASRPRSARPSTRPSAAGAWPSSPPPPRRCSDSRSRSVARRTTASCTAGGESATWQPPGVTCGLGWLNQASPAIGSTGACMARSDGITVLIGYDGSGPAQDAVDQAARLFPGGMALVATVWPSLRGRAGAARMAVPDEVIQQAVRGLDSTAEADATRTAEEGAARARNTGMRASPLAICAGTLRLGEPHRSRRRTRCPGHRDRLASWSLWPALNRARERVQRHRAPLPQAGGRGAPGRCRCQAPANPGVPVSPIRQRRIVTMRLARSRPCAGRRYLFALHALQLPLIDGGCAATMPVSTDAHRRRKLDSSGENKRGEQPCST